jgi:hypothetical protein
MTVPEMFAVLVSLTWAAAGLAFGLRLGCFAALGLGLAAWFVGLLLGAFVTIGSGDLNVWCRRPAERRPRLAAALARTGGPAFLAVYTALLLGPAGLLVMTRPYPPG